MATYNEAKLKNLLAAHVPGTILVAPWLEQQGISHDLQKYYRRSGWLETAGTGAFKRPGEQVTWQAASMRCKWKATLLSMQGH
jgi:hypothetical protein